MDKTIIKIIEKLERNGYEAYLVGGFVRDQLIGIKSNDIDICTNALPKDLYKLFNVKANNYGGINFHIGKYNVDITTYRKETNYVNRRPNVTYVSSLEEDLKRRDFTINSICMDKTAKVIDLLNGVEDLNNRTIKMIGDIDTKLTEDPLRILRAIRFYTLLDYELDSNLLIGIKNNYKLVKSLSKTRVREEFDKILMSKNFLKGFKLMDEIGILRVLNISYGDINYVDDLLGMWAQIKTKDIPFTNNEKRSIIKIAEIVEKGHIDNEVLYDYGLYLSTVAGLILNINPKDINKLYKEMPIKDTKDIDITAKDLNILNITGREIGKIYNIVKEKILNNKLINKKETIIDFIKKRK